MWSSQRKYDCAFLALILGAQGCAERQFFEERQNVPVVPVSAVIDSLKCGLSQSLEIDAQGRSGLDQATAVVKLEVNVVASQKADGSVSVGIPISTGASGTPIFSTTRDTKLTRNSTIDFAIFISGYNTAACAATEGRFGDAGFSSWLSQIVREINSAIAGPPLASIRKYTYDSNFVITKSADAGADFTMIPVTIDGSVSATRSDIQHINIQIEAVRNAKGKPGHGFGWFRTDPKPRKAIP